MGNQPLSEAFCEIVSLAERLGVRRINGLPGCWEYADGDWFVAVNAHGEETACSRGAAVPPFHAYVERLGWPAALLNPRGGHIVGDAGAEDALIAWLKTQPALTKPEGVEE